MDFSKSDGRPYDDSREEVDRAAAPEEAPSVIFSEHVVSSVPREYFYDFEDKKGLAIILNHYQYSKKIYRVVPLCRNGTAADLALLKATFTNLNFDVEDHTDLSYNQILDVVIEVSRRDHSKTSCLVICVMTHGEKGGQLFAHDRVYSTSDIFCHFTGDACPALAAAPKLFFLQACRGKVMDDGVEATTEIDSPSRDTIKIPTSANFLIMYSTIEEFVSWRDNSGSWFIKALCEELALRHSTMDLLQILTLVNWRIAYCRASNVPTDVSKHGKKQMPQIVSTLTKNVSFRKQW